MAYARFLPVLAALISVVPAQLIAQSGRDTWRERISEPPPVIGDVEDDRARTFQLLDRRPTDGFLLRSTSTLSPPLNAGANGFRWVVFAPQLRTVWNSKIPYSLNDGVLWAGRGWTMQVLAGVRAEYRNVSLILAPQFIRSENRDFQTIPSAVRGRSSWVPPWYARSPSADLPYRPGDLPYTLFDLGQSSLSVRAGPITLGAATENQWWGPGIRNAIVLSNNAAGVPHLFVRTSRPARTRFGAFEAKWLVGGLTESLYFDTDPDNDIRSLSALVATFTPAAEPGLTFGVARSVYAAVSGAGAVPGRFFDVVTHWDRAHLEAPAEGDRAAEQILSLFGRWVFPESGFEGYVEWARLELPRSFRDFLTMPHHTQGYTIGLQWARPVRMETGIVRVQSEATYLEQSSTFRQRPTPMFYVSPAVIQGYTHRGQSLGAAIGPGASSQWLAVDYLAGSWQAGAFGGRVRWDNDAYYRQPTGRSEVAHDVSVLGGLRGSLDLPRVRLSAEITRTQRYNYLYQNLLQGFTAAGAVDPTNTTFAITLSPRLPSREPGQ